MYINIQIRMRTKPESCGGVAAIVRCFCFITVAAVIVLWLGAIVSVVCSVVFSKGCKPFMRDLTRAATSISFKGPGM